MLKPTPLPYTYLPPAAQVTVSMGGRGGGGPRGREIPTSARAVRSGRASGMPLELVLVDAANLRRIRLTWSSPWRPVLFLL